jgi:hypothetical protein
MCDCSAVPIIIKKVLIFTCMSTFFISIYKKSMTQLPGTHTKNESKNISKLLEQSILIRRSEI